MNGWTALVPLRLGSATKSRLAECCDDPGRIALATAMAQHVLGELAQCPQIARVVLLTPEPPVWWHGEVMQDRARGLNAELADWRRRHPQEALLVIHADLPLLAAAEVGVLLGTAERAGCAIAPDRLQSGTNAAALAPGSSLEFRFGVDSRAAFLGQRPDIAEVIQPGLAHDLDTPEDIAFLRQLGWSGLGLAART